MRTEQYIPPPGARVRRIQGYLYETDDPRDCGEDMLEIILDNGVVITAGWSHEGDRHGHYLISAFVDEDRMGQPIEVKSFDQLKEELDLAVERFHLLDAKVF